MDPANGAQDSGSFLTPLLISLAGIVATCLALIVYHFLLVKYCLRWGDKPDDATNPSIPTGLQQKILGTIPILSFSRDKDEELGTHQTECAVCLGELKEGETIRFLESPPANHIGGERVPDLARNIGQGGDQAASTSGVQSNTLLRHCVPLVFPRVSKTHVITGLKGSLSMDQFHIYINLIDDSGDASSLTSKMILWKSNSCKAPSMRQLDRMSSLLRSFSQ
ncbi:uncharacterized protein LOC108458946 [Gossypium arboreum]|uniref:RING-type E3 ubiquitin transferase n=1 Tax=Gossypium arboreum TaxID=29729 RepID=A0ABR0QBM8_GOSAR|nr:uncharacterized protein LOC108458946 [Gossypium arboreum]KAK5836362.1 hypothetical protein PVK06_012148 [Gossypium arboreum]